jgi:hypothetical protein
LGFLPVTKHGFQSSLSFFMTLTRVGEYTISRFRLQPSLRSYSSREETSLPAPFSWSISAQAYIITSNEGEINVLNLGLDLQFVKRKCRVLSAKKVLLANIYFDTQE